LDKPAQVGFIPACAFSYRPAQRMRCCQRTGLSPARPVRRACYGTARRPRLGRRPCQGGHPGSVGGGPSSSLISIVMAAYVSGGRVVRDDRDDWMGRIMTVVSTARARGQDLLTFLRRDLGRGEAIVSFRPPGVIVVYPVGPDVPSAPSSFGQRTCKAARDYACPPIRIRRQVGWVKLNKRTASRC